MASAGDNAMVTALPADPTPSSETQVDYSDVEKQEEKIHPPDDTDDESDHRIAPNILKRTASGVSAAGSRILGYSNRRSFSIPANVPIEKTPEDYIVDFEGPDDPYRPINWPMKKKVYTTLLYSLTTMTSTLSSAIFSPATSIVAQEFGVGEEVVILGTSLMLFGFGVGPLIFAPISELYGRKIAVLIPTFISMIFAFGAGAGKDIQTILICRFFQGFFGSAPITNTGGVLGDLFKAQDRGAAIVGYAIAVIGGPTLGPVIGGAIVVNTTWRWVQYTSGIYTAVMLILDWIFIDETFSGALLVAKARRLRLETGVWAFHAKHEEWDVSFKELGEKYLIRPFALLATPICFLMALYASFVYGLFYASLGAFPYIFQTLRGWNPVVGGLPFLAMLVGVLMASVINLINQKYYIKKCNAAGNRPVPEARLPPMMLGGVVFVAGTFIFAWTAAPGVFWFVPMVGAALMGLGFVTVFQAALNYLIDTFQQYGASAVAANTFLRSMFAGMFPLFIDQQLRAMGVGWGLSVYGFFAVLLIPIPFLFTIYGKRIRAAGKWSRASVYD